MTFAGSSSDSHRQTNGSGPPSRPPPQVYPLTFWPSALEAPNRPRRSAASCMTASASVQSTPSALTVRRPETDWLAYWMAPHDPACAVAPPPLLSLLVVVPEMPPATRVLDPLMSSALRRPVSGSAVGSSSSVPYDGLDESVPIAALVRAASRRLTSGSAGPPARGMRV